MVQKKNMYEKPEKARFEAQNPDVVSMSLK